MPLYRVIIDGQEIGDPIIAASHDDAYFDVASTTALTYQSDVKLIPIEANDNMPLTDK